MTVQFLSPKELAAAIGVSESSLKRWVDSGRLTVQRTAGGHRRIPIEEAVRFVRAEGYTVRDPACFGVACCGQVENADGLVDAVYTALKNGDAQQCQNLVTTAYLSGMTVPALCDGPLMLALGRIREASLQGDDSIVNKHVAASIVVQVIEHIRQHLRRLSDDAPVALGGGVCDHHCLVPSLMFGVTLQDAGFRPVNLGPNTPDGAVIAAAKRYKPALVWRAITNSERPEQTAADVCRLAEQLGPIPLVIGGREVHKLRLGCASRIHVIGSLCEFGAFARALALATIPAAMTVSS
jgi:excisionase family DNA binding protein